MGGACRWQQFEGSAVVAQRCAHVLSMIHRDVPERGPADEAVEQMLFHAYLAESPELEGKKQKQSPAC